MKIIGVYKITNPNGAVYIGSSIDIKRRFNQYKRLNNSGTELSKLLPISRSYLLSMLNGNRINKTPYKSA